MATTTSGAGSAPTTLGDELRGAWYQARQPGHRLTSALAAAVVLVGVGLRFYAPSALWLDEVITVNISKLPLSQIHAALREDGAPPLYYVMMHFWMLAFGRGDFAVRALGGIISVLALPCSWFAGRRLGGTRVAWITLLVAATSPFAIFYATDTRMYSLMVLWCVLGFLALSRALEHPSRSRLLAVGALTAALLYTHYWALYLLSATGAWLLYQIWRGRRGLPARVDPLAATRIFGAMVLGSLLFVPWVPTFLFQARHTGTPWAPAPSAADLVEIFDDYAGTGAWAVLLAFFYFAFFFLGVFGRRPSSAPEAGELLDHYGDHRSDGEHHPDDRVGIGHLGSGAQSGSSDGLSGVDDLGTAVGPPGIHQRLVRLGDRVVGLVGFGPSGAGSPGRSAEGGVTVVLGLNRKAMPLLAVFVGTLLLALAGGIIDDAAFVSRYTAAVLPLFLLLVALGVDLLARRRLVNGALALLCVAGLLTGVADNSQPRTQAVQVAQVLNAEARPGDLVVYCPDQLGPAVSRLVDVPGLEQLTFPRAIGPERVDWIDYRKVVEGTDVESFAQDMLATLQPGHTLWLVWRNGYAPFGGDCGDLASWFSLRLGQGTTVVRANPSFLYEHENLVRYPLG
ncbi:MAG: glycosyltransferase family 39 protein [Actinomycetota bacterium]|nr:glycosyltransferase family 39 protein [Actinomycetota bacterium]